MAVMFFPAKNALEIPYYDLDENSNEIRIYFDTFPSMTLPHHEFLVFAKYLGIAHEPDDYSGVIPYAKMRTLYDRIQKILPREENPIQERAAQLEQTVLHCLYHKCDLRFY